jgi:3-oxoadipate enol-lactonase
MPIANVNGSELYYERYGAGDETVLFANGVLANTASWFHQVPLFSKKYQVICYDCRGQGRSEKPDEDCTLEMHADDLEALLGALDIQSAHMVGISYGGEIGMGLALKHPERVRSLVVADAVSQVDTRLAAKIEGWLAAARRGDPDLFFQITAPDIFSENYMRDNPAFMRALKEQYAKLDYRAVVHLIARFREFHITEQLSQIALPVLVLCGELDTLKPVRYSQLIHRQIPGSEFIVVPEAGHALSYERPQEFNTLVLGFLAKQRLPRVH